MKKLSLALAGLAVAAALTAAPATVQPTEQVGSAQAATACPKLSGAYNYKVTLSGATSSKLFFTWSGAYNYLHEPDYRTGTLYAWIGYRYPNGYCAYYWQAKHFDTSRTS